MALVASPDVGVGGRALLGHLAAALCRRVPAFVGQAHRLLPNHGNPSEAGRPTILRRQPLPHSLRLYSRSAEPVCSCG